MNSKKREFCMLNRPHKLDALKRNLNGKEKQGLFSCIFYQCSMGREGCRDASGPSPALGMM